MSGIDKTHVLYYKHQSHDTHEHKSIGIHAVHQLGYYVTIPDLALGGAVMEYYNTRKELGSPERPITMEQFLSKESLIHLDNGYVLIIRNHTGNNITESYQRLATYAKRIQSEASLLIVGGHIAVAIINQQLLLNNEHY